MNASSAERSGSSQAMKNHGVPRVVIEIGETKRIRLLASDAAAAE
jgi:hypothetical protein